MAAKSGKAVLQKMSAELDESIIFQCDRCDCEIEKEDALETHVELYHVNVQYQF